jgi:hypothetical protein
MRRVILLCALLCGCDPDALTDATPGRSAVTRLRGCASTCNDRNPTDLATCRLECVEAVTRMLADPERRDCQHDCLDRLERSGAACAREHTADDRATCELQSDEQAAHCIDACAPSGS